jgi:hypothetical protein
VAILTLEVTGIPELSENREFPWPNPHFIESTGAFVFEVSDDERDGGIELFRFSTKHYLI